MIPRTVFCFHDPEPTGASLWLREFLLHAPLDAKNCAVVFPGPSPMETPLKERGFAVRFVELSGGDIVRKNPFHLLRLMQQRHRAVRQYARVFEQEKATVVYVNSSVQIAPMLGAHHAGLPLAVHVHEAFPFGRTHRIKRTALRRYAKTAIFAATAGMKLFGPQPPNGRWEFSPNGVPQKLSTLREERRRLREQYGWKEEEIILLFLGVMNKLKGLRDLLEVFKDLRSADPTLRLTLAGKTNEFETDPVIRALPNDAPEGVDFLGFRSDPHELLAAADFFVLPSYAEAMPISISEAMMIRTPVIARSVGDIGWQIGEGRGYLFEGDGPEPFRHALEQALSNRTEATQRATAAQSFALEHLTDTQQHEQILRIIEETARQ